MNKLTHLFLLFLLVTNAFSQAQPDTIYVSTNKTTTLMFPKDVILFDIGSEDFGGMKSNNLLLLKAVIDKAQPTSILVQYGRDEIYHATLVFKADPAKTFLDFRTAELPKVPSEARTAKKDSTATLESQVAEKRLNLLIADTRVSYKTLAIQKEKLILSLSDMMIDEENLYLKVLFVNDSKLDYQIDFVEFVYKEPSEKKELKGGYERKNVYAKVHNKIDGVRGKDKRFLGYCIPKYALSKKGELEIVVREKNGTRVLELSVPFTEILTATHVSKR